MIESSVLVLLKFVDYFINRLIVDWGTPLHASRDNPDSASDLAQPRLFTSGSDRCLPNYFSFTYAERDLVNQLSLKSASVL